VDRLRFWFREFRTPELLIVELCRRYPGQAREESRPAVIAARSGDYNAAEAALAAEEREERARDRAYWKPLRAELERMRFAKRPPD
jgi:hypothetical protein